MLGFQHLVVFLGPSWSLLRQNRSDEASNCAMEDVSSGRHSRCSWVRRFKTKQLGISCWFKQRRVLARWWQLKNIFFEFSSRNLGKISKLTIIFSDGLKPPTSYMLLLEILYLLSIEYNFEWVRSKVMNWPESIDVIRPDQDFPLVTSWKKKPEDSRTKSQGISNLSWSDSGSKSKYSSFGTSQGFVYVSHSFRIHCQWLSFHSNSKETKGHHFFKQRACRKISEWRDVWKRFKGDISFQTWPPFQTWI